MENNKKNIIGKARISRFQVQGDPNLGIPNKLAIYKETEIIAGIEPEGIYIGDRGAGWYPFAGKWCGIITIRDAKTNEIRYKNPRIAKTYASEAPIDDDKRAEEIRNQGQWSTVF
jgi:diacylglycerol kinase family enzyme